MTQGYFPEHDHFLRHLFHNFIFVFLILLLRSKEIKSLACVANKQTCNNSTGFYYTVKTYTTHIRITY